jgi:hypothetical protein
MPTQTPLHDAISRKPHGAARATYDKHGALNAFHGGMAENPSTTFLFICSKDSGVSNAGAGAIVWISATSYHVDKRYDTPCMTINTLHDNQHPTQA